MALEIDQTTAPSAPAAVTPDPLAGFSETERELIAKGEKVVHGNGKTFERPEWVPVKFFNVATGEVDTQGLAKSYSELEKKLGGKPADSAPETPAAATPEAPATPTPEEASEKFQGYFAEFAEKGALSEQSYKDLAAKHGLPKDVVDSYIEGQRLRATYGEDQLLASVGGRDTYKVMSQWAAASLSDKELSAFNAQVALSAESAGIALQWLKTKYEDANGKAPKLVTGKAGQSGPDGFASRAEMMEAMRDKRYGIDRVFTAEVARKMASRSFSF